ncbi:MAG: dephospho-CoA kinase [Candidatus Omnitrophica bacterium]|nr:dephospho-CoA kinase [Candidatus Omnitrophota bacterium]MDD5592362.1 dephospho-CoA kinase [Candidatus Omnitrophota bacterium]
MKRQSRDKKITLGLTGSFGSGKTTVAGIFRSYGAKVIDADRIAHSVIKPGTGVYQAIVSAFGRNILKGGKSVNRKKLAAIVFDDPGSLGRLNKIMHPEIIRIIKKKISSIPGGVIVLDAPLLIEKGLEKIADKLIVVNITAKKQIERVAQKTGANKEDILKRIKAQIPLRNKVRLADFVIDNSGSKEETRKQVQKIRRLLWRS